MAKKANPAARAAYRRGEKYMDVDDFDNALKKYTEAIELDPGFAEAWCDRGMAYNGLELFDDALRDFCEALRLDPDVPDYYYFRGDALAEKGRYDEAISDYNEAIRLDDRPFDLFMVYSSRGYACAEKGLLEDAVNDYTRSLELMNKFKLLGRLATIVSSDIKQARAMILVGRGKACVGLGRYDESILDFNEAIRTDPQYADSYTALALTEIVPALVQAGRLTDALTFFKGPNPQMAPFGSDSKPSAVTAITDKKPCVPFADKLLEWIRVKGFDHVEVYRRACIADKHFSKIISSNRRNPDYVPKKETVVAFAIGLRLTLDETQALLWHAGYTLSTNLPADAVYMKFITQQKYNIVDINFALHDLGLSKYLLGAGVRDEKE